MNKQDHLLTIVAEECSEVQKLCCEALRFGIDGFNLSINESNEVGLLREINGLVASIEMLFNRSIENIVDDNSILNKMEKVERWLKYSELKGRLNKSER